MAAFQTWDVERGNNSGALHGDARVGSLLLDTASSSSPEDANGFKSTFQCATVFVIIASFLGTFTKGILILGIIVKWGCFDALFESVISIIQEL